MRKKAQALLALMACGLHSLYTFPFIPLSHQPWLVSISPLTNPVKSSSSPTPSPSQNTSDSSCITEPTLSWFRALFHVSCSTVQHSSLCYPSLGCPTLQLAPSTPTDSSRGRIWCMPGTLHSQGCADPQDCAGLLGKGQSRYQLLFRNGKTSRSSGWPGDEEGI